MTRPEGSSAIEFALGHLRNPCAVQIQTSKCCVLEEEVGHHKSDRKHDAGGGVFVFSGVGPWVNVCIFK